MTEDDYRPDLTDVIPFDAIRPYDVRKVIEQVVDEDSFMEVHKDFAKNIVVGFARIKGEVSWTCLQSTESYGWWT